MFKNHQPLIEAWAKESPEKTAHVIKFVLASIRCHFERIPERLEKALDGNLRELTPYARDGFAYVDSTDLRCENTDDASLLAWYTQVPGIGIVKAGFIVQLLHGRTGCLDTHNLRIYGLNPNVFKMPAKAEALYKRCKLYADVCLTLGGAERLWNRWCQEIVNLRPKEWHHPNVVSQAHVDFILQTFRR